MNWLNIGRIRPPSSRTMHGHVVVDLLALGLVEFGARRQQHLVEVRALEARVVPVGRRQIGGRVHLVLGRAAAPVGCAEGLLVPDLVPVAVAGLALELDLDAGLGGALLEELGGIDRAREGDVRGPQQHGAVVARLLVVELGLVGIVLALLDLGEQRIGRVDREVVAERAVAAQDLLQHLLAVDRQLQRHPEIVVVERRRIAMHDEDIVAADRRWLRMVTPGTRLIRSTIFGSTRLIMLTWPPCSAAMRAVAIVDDDDFDLVGMAHLVALPVVGETARRHGARRAR